MTNQTKSNNNLVIPLIIIFCLMVVMVAYTSQIVRSVTVENIHEVGDDKLTGICAQMENYLETTKSVLRVTADTVDYMVTTGEPTEKIRQYILAQTSVQAQYFDDNYTGLYGYVRGQFLDGLNWVPDDDYVPTERDWYLYAIDAGGETTIVPPYVDAQTGEVVITITRQLSDGENVVAVDLMVNYIQEMMSELKVRDQGYGFIFDQDGLIIAHSDETLKGHYMSDISGMSGLMEQAMVDEDGCFEIDINGEKNTVFVHTIMDQWYVVIIISNTELYSDLTNQIAFNVVICVVIFALVGLFYILGYKKERQYSARIEEMREEEQKQAYEAQVLKFEKESADAANRAKSEFLAQMSHEIRTPINAVIGMDEMILRQTEDPDIKEYALDIKSASKTLLSLVNGVLDFSKIESGKMEIVPVNYSTENLINDLVNMISDRAEKKGLVLDLEIDENLPRGLFGDDVRLKQVIINLLTNAVKYTKQGTVTLTMKRGELKDDKCSLYVSVKDTGIGIKEEDKERMFQSFQRLDERRNRNIEGTGLGMPIVQGILNMMGSSIDVRSEYGVGSEFSFSVEQGLVDATPIGEYHTHHVEAQEEAKRESLHVLKADILVVDDNEMNLKVAKGLLKRINVTPDLAGGGREAVEMIGNKHYDIVLMDHMMPVMDGIEALKLIKERNLIDNSTKVIALTANAIAGAKEMYLAEGFNDYLSKPIVPEMLDDMIAKYLPSENYRYGDLMEKTEAPSDESEMLSKLRSNGFNVDAALTYCMNDEEFLKELLVSFIDSEDEKTEAISSNYKERNWDDYSTYVHALKSSSRTIGADKLSDMAWTQENASKVRDEAVVDGGYENMMSEYRRIVKILKSILGENEDGSDEDSGDSDILEFFPE